MSQHPQKHLVLLGAGRANLQVLRGFARRGRSELGITLIDAHPYYIERSMLAAYVAGDYMLDDIRIPLQPLLEASGANWVSAQVQALEPNARRVLLSGGATVSYDLLAINAQPEWAREQLEADLPGARHNAMLLWPLANFVQLWPRLQALAAERALHVALMGGGRIALELALAMAQALAEPHGTRITWLTPDEAPLKTLPSKLQRRLDERFKQWGVTILRDRCVAIQERELHLASGARLACDAPVLLSPPNSPDWLLQAGLQAGDDGQPLVNARLQSESHRQVFVVPARAPLAVGAALEHNLRTALDGGSFSKAPLHASGLRVLYTGAGRAAAMWGPLALEGREVWFWRDRRMRRQLASLLEL